MAKLMTSLTLCSGRMTHGERRVAQRLESHLGDDCLIWYDIPVGRQYRHPDFVIIDPANGLIFLEVKDWKLSTFQHADPQTVTLRHAQGETQAQNPLLQVREYACATVDLLSQDPKLQQKTGLYKGKLNIAWAYGVVFTNITRQQLTSLSADGVVESLFPQALTICQDEMTECYADTGNKCKLPGMSYKIKGVSLLAIGRSHVHELIMIVGNSNRSGRVYCYIPPGEAPKFTAYRAGRSFVTSVEI